jgi:hypothetical protein
MKDFSCLFPPSIEQQQPPKKAITLGSFLVFSVFFNGGVLFFPMQRARVFSSSSFLLFL